MAKLPDRGLAAPSLTESRSLPRLPGRPKSASFDGGLWQSARGVEEPADRRVPKRKRSVTRSTATVRSSWETMVG